MNEALRVYTRWLPQLVIDSIMTVADQQLYELDNPELLNIKDVFWDGGSSIGIIDPFRSCGYSLYGQHAGGFNIGNIAHFYLSIYILPSSSPCTLNTYGSCIS